MGAQPAWLVGAQSTELAPDWDDKDANTLLKLASRTRFCESAGNKIKEFVADLEMYLRMCGRFVNRWLLSHGFARRRGSRESKALSSSRRICGFSEV